MWNPAWSVVEDCSPIGTIKKTNKQIAKTSQLEELEIQKNFENKILQDKVSQLEARLIETNSELADARSKLIEKEN